MPSGSTGRVGVGVSVTSTSLVGVCESSGYSVVTFAVFVSLPLSCFVTLALNVIKIGTSYVITSSFVLIPFSLMDSFTTDSPFIANVSGTNSSPSGNSSSTTTFNRLVSLLRFFASIVYVIISPSLASLTSETLLVSKIPLLGTKSNLFNLNCCKFVLPPVDAEINKVDSSPTKYLSTCLLHLFPSYSTDKVLL